jgi:hypothetical protein
MSLNVPSRLHPRALLSAFIRVVGVPLVLVMLVVGSTVVLSETSPKDAAFAFRAQLVDQDPSPTLAPGATTSYTIRLRNVGLVPWQRGTTRQVKLGIVGDATTYADLGMSVGWISANRPATTSEAFVLPGMIGTFSFTIRAPATPGTYRVSLRPVVDGVAWIETQPVVLTLTSDLGFHSQLLDQSAHPTIKPGELSGPITVRVRNTGAKTWLLGVAGQQANLGILGDDRSLMGLGWGWPSPDRVAVQNEAAVRPGGIGTFTFQVRAPTTPGSYALPLRLVVDGVTWLEDDHIVTIVSVLGSTTSIPAATAGGLAQPGAKPLRTPSFTASVSVSQGNVPAGTTEMFSAQFTSDMTATAVVGIEVYAPGGATLAFQKWLHNETFEAGQQRAYDIAWSIPAGSPAGTYTVNAAAYANGWKKLYGAKPLAASFTVTEAAAVIPAPTPSTAPTAAPVPTAVIAPPTAAPTAASSPTASPATAAPTSTAAATVAPTSAPTPAPAPSFTTTASVAAASVVPGGSLALTAFVTSATAMSALVDVEIYAPAGNQVYQVYFDNQTFAAGQQRSYPATWSLPLGTAPGTYTVKIGVFAPTWVSLYTWNDSAALFSVAAATPTATPFITPAPTATAAPPPVAPTVAPTLAPAPTATPGGAFALIPSDRLTTWNPGIPGGIPARTTVCASVSATTYGNGSSDATAAIQAAINACPVGQVVQLSAGTFKITSTLLITKGIVLRGMGPTQTKLMMPVGTNANLITVGTRWFKFVQPTNLASNAVKGSRTVTLASVPPGLAPGEVVAIDQVTDTNVTEWNAKSPPGDPSRGWFGRPNRPVGQIMEIASVSGNSVTFTTPFHITFQTAFQAQLSRFSNDPNAPVIPAVKYAGIEDLYVYGGSQGQGNISLANAAYSWVKNIESDFQDGPSVAIDGSFRCVLRDSYVHSTQNPNPGGGGYGVSFSFYSADNLVENNIVWNMNKVMVMRTSGGGNVIGYNYMEDGWISYNTGWVEVGLNASHMTTPHYELFEGNQAFNFDADNTWGNAVYITAFRNHLTGQRRSVAPLALSDTQNRRAAGLMEGHWWYSFVGNVLGTPGMSSAIDVWELGYNPENWSAPPDPKVLSTVVREGNFDYLSNAVQWSGAPGQIPASLYLTSKPAFFGSNPWPWVDPTGATKLATLPARARFDAMGH